MAHEFTQPRAFLQPKFSGAQGYVSSATPLRWAIRQSGSRGFDDLLGNKHDQRVQILLYPGSYGTYETYGIFSQTRQWLKLQVCKKLPLKMMISIPFAD